MADKTKQTEKEIKPKESHRQARIDTEDGEQGDVL